MENSLGLAYFSVRTDEKWCPHGLFFCPWQTENSLRLACSLFRP